MAKYYLLDENKNLVEGFDKEGFLGILEQAIENGDLEDIDEDSAVASKLRSTLNGSTHHIEFVTQAQYNQLVADEELVANTYYFITDDTTEEDIEEHLSTIDTELEGQAEGISDLETLTEQLNNYNDGTMYQGLDLVLTGAYDYFNDQSRTTAELKKTFVAHYIGEMSIVSKIEIKLAFIDNLTIYHFFTTQGTREGVAIWGGSTWDIKYLVDNNNLRYNAYKEETKAVSDLTLAYVRKCINIEFSTYTTSQGTTYHKCYYLYNDQTQKVVIYRIDSNSALSDSDYVSCTYIDFDNI